MTKGLFGYEIFGCRACCNYFFGPVSHGTCELCRGHQIFEADVEKLEGLFMETWEPNPDVRYNREPTPTRKEFESWVIEKMENAMLGKYLEL